jgi:hypothetical protein
MSCLTSQTIHEADYIVSKTNFVQAETARRSLEEIKLDITETKEQVVAGIVAIRYDIETSKGLISKMLSGFRDNAQKSFANMVQKTESLATVAVGT